MHPVNMPFVRPEALAANGDLEECCTTIRWSAGFAALTRILVVDDDPAVQMTIRLILERAGHSVVVAADGQKGLAAFESGDFDLVFLDIFMPGMDGLETMRAIRQRSPAMPIIVISGRPVTPGTAAEPDYLSMAVKLGAVSSLSKPFRPAELLATVDACLAAAARPPSIPANRDAASGP